MCRIVLYQAKASSYRRFPSIGSQIYDNDKSEKIVIGVGNKS